MLQRLLSVLATGGATDLTQAGSAFYQHAIDKFGGIDSVAKAALACVDPLIATLQGKQLSAAM